MLGLIRDDTTRAHHAFESLNKDQRVALDRFCRQVLPRLIGR